MALMSYREPNEVKWVGCRPGHRGTQVLVYKQVVNGCSILYTVPVGKVFYLSFYSFECRVAAVGTGEFYIDDTVNYQGFLAGFDIMTVAGALPSAICAFNFPIEIPAGWRIVCCSSVAILTVRATIHGWVESV